jgi:uncharacterized protein (TIGR00106 family)
MEITVYPLGAGQASISHNVAEIFKVLDTCGLHYEVTVMGTIVEGAPDELFALAQRLHESLFDSEISRVVTMIRIDDRRDK